MGLEAHLKLGVKCMLYLFVVIESEGCEFKPAWLAKLTVQGLLLCLRVLLTRALVDSRELYWDRIFSEAITCWCSVSRVVEVFPLVYNVGTPM